MERGPVSLRIVTLRTHWVLVVMDQFTRRIIGFGIHRGTIDGPSLCRMFRRAIQGQSLPTYLSTDHHPLYRFHQWQANLRVLEVVEIKTVPYVPLLHPFVERLLGTLRRECLNRTLFLRTWRQSCESFRKYINPPTRGVRRTPARLFCLVSLSEALSRVVPDADCRVILRIRHAQGWVRPTPGVIQEPASAWLS